MRRGPWWIPVVCGLLSACGQGGGGGEGVFSARSPDGPLPGDDVTSPADVTEAASPAGMSTAVLRPKLKELAVASECLRRGDIEPETIATTMLALYEKHGIDLATYAQEMGRLGGDAAFQAEIQAELARCPAAVSVEVAAPADVTGEPEDVSGAVEVESETDVETELPHAGPDTESGAEPDVGDEGPEDVASSADVRETPEDKAPDWSGTWTGAIRGSASGTLRVSIRGRSVGSATLALAGRNIRLQGVLAKNGHLSLGGRIGDGNFIRLRGRIDRSGKALSGTWDGVVDRKRAQGTMSLTR